MIGWDEYFRHFPNGALQQSSMWIRSSEIHDWGFSDKGWDMKYIFQTWYVFSNHEIYFQIMKYIFQIWNLSFKHEISQNIHSKHRQRPSINIEFFCSLTTKKSNRVETPFLFRNLWQSDRMTHWHQSYQGPHNGQHLWLLERRTLCSIFLGWSKQRSKYE